MGLRNGEEPNNRVVVTKKNLDSVHAKTEILVTMYSNHMAKQRFAVLGLIVVLNFLLFFFFLIAPYYLLGAEYYIPKSSPMWGFAMPNSPEAWFFFTLAFVFLALWAFTLILFMRKRSDISQRGIHPTIQSE